MKIEKIVKNDKIIAHIVSDKKETTDAGSALDVMRSTKEEAIRKLLLD